MKSGCLRGCNGASDETSAADETVVALVNFLAILGGLILLWKVLRAIIRFTANAYQSSFKVAVKRFREALDNDARACAEDTSLFIARLAQYALIIVMCIASILVGIGGGLSADLNEAPNTVRFWRTGNLAWLVLLVSFTWQASSLAAKVARIRLAKLMARLARERETEDLTP